MPQMGSNVGNGNPVVVSAFHTSLFHQTLLVALLVVLLWTGWNVLRSLRYRRAVAAGAVPAGHSTAQRAVQPSVPAPPEAPARRMLRIGFGLLWLLDGLLQAQSGMPLGLPSQVLQPAASSSPRWVQHLVNIGAAAWNNHPVQAAAAAVWIQVGIGALLLVAPRGRWQRAAGLVSLGWGLVVWCFGEAFGGLFGSGVSWLSGAPGAALLYCAAGLLIALPERWWSTPTLGRVVLRTVGVFFVAMATLQAWPGRGSWQGSAGHSSLGATASVVQQGAQNQQPGFLAALLRAFERFDVAHGWAVNLVVVLVLCAIGIALCVATERTVRPAVYAALVVCLVDWVLVQDLGFLGGTGTDPNSMVPLALLILSGYVALTRPAPVRAPSPAPAEAETGAGPSTVVSPELGEQATTDTGAWWERVPLGYLSRVAASVAALLVVLLGAVPMASAATNPNADPILAVAADGQPNALDSPAPDFHLTDQNGAPVSLTDLRGHTLALTFLDPVCTSDCPVIAQEFRDADAILGDPGQVDFIAVVANPIYRATSFTRAFDQQEGLAHVRNWLYLTGSVSALQQMWNDYGIAVEVAPGGAMIAHSELAFIIDGQGETREVL
ncbi:MAG TPA: SCO family protein, partial [Acidimicrobiales bacterium]|nr:SCO family protein [Acidimicrobiales bacterium]